MFRHRFDPSSMVAGVLFLGLAALFLAAGFGGPRVSFGWAVPVVLIGLGVIGVLRIVFRARRRPGDGQGLDRNGPGGAPHA